MPCIVSCSVILLLFRATFDSIREKSEKPKQAKRQDDVGEPKQITTKDVVFHANCEYTCSHSRCDCPDATLDGQCD